MEVLFYTIKHPDDEYMNVYKMISLYMFYCFPIYCQICTIANVQMSAVINKIYVSPVFIIHSS